MDLHSRCLFLLNVNMNQLTGKQTDRNDIYTHLYKKKILISEVLSKSDRHCLAHSINEDKNYSASVQAIEFARVSPRALCSTASFTRGSNDNRERTRPR